MIYKISLMVGVVAVIAAISLADMYSGKAQQAVQQLNESKERLAVAQENEKKSGEQLEAHIREYGDISEEKFKELKEGIKAKRAELTAASSEYMEAFNQAHDAEKRNREVELKLSQKIDTLKNNISKLEKELEELKTPLEPADPFSPENINRVVNARMNIHRVENVNLAYFKALYSDEIVLLRSRPVVLIPVEEELKTVKMFIDAFSPRAEKLIAVGVNKEIGRIEIILACVFKARKGSKRAREDTSGYMVVTYNMDSDGRVGGTMEEFYEANEPRPTLSEGFVPFEYTGETIIVSE